MFDKLFLDTGVEEEDITYAFVTQGIQEREDFKKIMVEAKQIMTEKVQTLLNKLAGQHVAG